MIKWIRVIAVLLSCMMLTACKGSRTKAFSDAPTIPDQVDFMVGFVCDLTDAEGKTPHCGSPEDFYGTIEGKAGLMTGENPAYFHFTVPYSEKYRFPSNGFPAAINREL